MGQRIRSANAWPKRPWRRRSLMIAGNRLAPDLLADEPAIFNQPAIVGIVEVRAITAHLEVPEVLEAAHTDAPGRIRIAVHDVHLRVRILDVILQALVVHAGPPGILGLVAAAPVDMSGLPRLVSAHEVLARPPAALGMDVGKLLRGLGRSEVWP